MIERYSREKMRNIWDEQNKWNTFWKVELEATLSWARHGVVPLEDASKLQEVTSVDVKRLKEIEEVTHHDVVAFTRAVGEKLGSEKKWIHYGLTSTDIVDTAQALQLKAANDIIEQDIIEFMEVLKEKALLYKTTYCIGRTHGVHADITTFGLKFVLWHDELKRDLERFRLARKNIEVGKISGAVGNFANIPPFIEREVCDALDLGVSPISTQVVQRDNHAFYLSTIALIGSSIEKMAMEIRSLQRTEIREASEYFTKGQKGSSAMPHKKNPISSENICGCSRVLRGYMVTGFENIPLWHERDISHSSAERIILPDSTMLLDYMISRFTTVIKRLIVYPERMMKNIYLTNGVIFTQRVMSTLISEADMTREEAYDLVQPIAMNSFDNDLDFKNLLLSNDKILNALSKEQLNSCFSLEYYLVNLDEIYNRCGIN